MQRAWPSGGKQLLGGLALDGIAADIRAGPGPLPPAKAAAIGLAPVKPGTSMSTHGSLLVLKQILPDGTEVTYSASEDPIQSSVTHLLAIEAAVALVAFLLAALLLLRGSKTALRPLAQVSHTARRIAGGERSQRLRPDRTDTELGSMAAAFDQMVDALDAAIARAEGAETSMRTFLADASHELRTPVAALQATAETLLREQPDRPERDAIEAALAREAARLGRLIDDLLGLARSESQQQFVLIDLAEIARQAADHTAHRAPNVRITLSPCAHSPVHGDPGALNRLLLNLLDNAVAAVPSSDPTVSVSIRQLDGHIETTVTDNGPGIPDTQRQRIFERFARLDPSTPGHGLGLAIARRIARHHGGELTCEPTTTGATFRLLLPSANSPS
jgi:two-component system, OmpR family, sensor kinase